MPGNTVGPRAGQSWAQDDYQPASAAGTWPAPPAAAPPAAAPPRAAKPAGKTTAGHQLQRRTAKSRVDEWMDVDFKFGGSRIKRKAVALVLLGLPATVPLFFMLPALLTLNSNTFAVSVDDTLGTGAEVCLFLCLLVTPMVTLTRQHWFVPLRRWYGIMMAATSVGDAVAASITDTFAGGVFGRVAGHVFELMGFCMVMLLEGFGFERGDNGSGFAGDGDPVFHQRFYQYSACSLFLLTLRLPPVKRWIADRQQEGRMWLVWVTVGPIFAVFVLGFAFILNEQIFKGIDSFINHPSNE